MENHNDLIEESLNFELYVLEIENSLVFKGRSLDQWNKELAIPTIGVRQDLSMVELETMHLKTLSSIETVMSNLAISRSIYLRAKSEHEENMIRTYSIVRDELELANKRPTNDFVQKICEERCLTTRNRFNLSEIIFEFFQTQSYKLKQLNERLTSLNFTKRN